MAFPVYHSCSAPLCPGSAHRRSTALDRVALAALLLSQDGAIAMRDLPTGTLTLLFTDIEGSTRRLHALGDRYPAMLEEHRDLLRAAFAWYGGVEVDTQGDAFFVVFPQATKAVAAAVAAQRSLAEHDWPEELAVRV